MKPPEQIAKLLIEAMIVGARMQFRCNQSSRVRHDFDLKYPDGTVAAIEVTTSVTEKTMRQAAMISEKRKGWALCVRQKVSQWLVGASLTRREHQQNS